MTRLTDKKIRFLCRHIVDLKDWSVGDIAIQYAVTEGGIVHDDFDDSSLGLQLTTGIAAMIFASLWSLLRPDNYLRTFGLHAPGELEADGRRRGAGPAGPPGWRW